MIAFPARYSFLDICTSTHGVCGLLKPAPSEWVVNDVAECGLLSDSLTLYDVFVETISCLNVA